MKCLVLVIHVSERSRVILSPSYIDIMHVFSHGALGY